ncbi:MAG: T9SS type A sorting domain-containing protein [Chitinophagaceae bacterium]|nr:T9SS type A sorting domain-containing protein [Chitinophagaceae bacterium]
MKSIYTVILLFFFTKLNAVTRYVTPSGAGAMNGTSWANAFPGISLQTAINASAPGDEVWVQSGTYFTTLTANRNIWFNMINGVAIYGSFSGTETSVSQRVFTCGFSSILSAEIGVAGIADNSYHVISNSSLNTTAILDGFTITGANANFDLVGNDNRSLGGGMLNNGQNGGTCTPTIRNCLFTNNSALFGGGIFDHGQNGGNASPVISNCIFAFNNATGGGGAIDNFGYGGNASPVITNCVFYGNTATDRAGAMYCWGGGNGNASPTILNSVFVNNSSFDGGGIVCDRLNFVSGSSGTANPTIRNSIFWGNTAGGTGPQFITFGGGTFTATYSLIDISNQNPPHIISGPGTGNIFSAPTFLNILNAIGADNCWLTTDDGLQLQATSQGIDDGDNSGVPAFDIRGYNRISNGIVDMGAYELDLSIVPVSLFEFTGISHRNTNKLFWKTASENNSRSFEIERSIDGLRFEKIGEVVAADNSTITRYYQFADDRLTASAYYYRLKQNDADGKFAFSPVILLKQKDNKSEVIVFPNPVRNIATVVFDRNLVNEELLLFNSNGQQMTKLIINGNTTYFDLSKMPAGLYLLTNQEKGISVKIQKIVE